MQRKDIFNISLILILTLIFVKIVLAANPDVNSATLPTDYSNLFEDTAYSQDVDVANANDTGPLVFSDLLSNFSANNLFDINSTTGVISFTPLYQHVDAGNDVGGNYSILIIVSDSDSQNVSRWHFKIIAINDTPLFNQTFASQTATEDSLFYFDFNASDEEDGGECDVKPCNLSFVANYSWFLINYTNGRANFTPAYTEAGVWTINVTVNDTDGSSNSSYLVLTVNYVNDTPLFNQTVPPSAQSVNEDSLFSFDFNASDEEDGAECDTKPCNLTFVANYSWFLINQTTGRVDFTPTNSEVGTWVVNITVNDTAGKTNSTYMTLKVASVNDGPHFTVLQNFTGYTNTFFYFDINASDVDIDVVGDAVNYTWNVTKFASTNANFSALNSTDGVISFIPNSSHIGTHWINVTIRDANSTSNSTIINFTIYNNTAPIFLAANFTATENAAFYYNLTLNFTDLEGDLMNFFDNTSLFDIDRTTGNITFNNFNDTFVRTNWVNITVNDSKGAQASYIINFSITNVNDLPTITTITDQSIAHNSSFNFQVVAADNDSVSSSGETLRYYDNSSLFEINRTNGAINFTPTYDQVGTYRINITVNDSAAGSASLIFNLTITNAAPALAAIGVQRINTYHTLTLIINATDAENDTLFFYDNTSLFDVNISSGVLSFTPNKSHIGSHFINISVLDAVDSSDYEVVNFSVYNNTAPSCTSNLNANFGSARNFTINENATTGLFTVSSCTDSDGDNLTYYWYWTGSLNKTATPTGDNTQNTFTYNATYSDAGENNVSVTVTDGNLNYTFYWNVTVNNTNSPVFSVLTISNQSVVESTALTLNLSQYFFDHDTADILNFTIYSYTINETFPTSTNASENSTWGAQAGNWTIGGDVYNQTATTATALSFYTNFSFTDFSLVFKVRLNSEGGAGVCFKAQDTNCDSGFRAYIDSSADTLNFDMKNNGTASSLTTNSSTFSTDTFYWVKVVTRSSDSKIFVSSDGVNYTTQLNVSAINFTSGKIGLFTLNTSATFDGITLNETGMRNFTTTFNQTLKEASFTPNTGFTGQRSGVLTASDGNGSFAKSNIFFVDVLAGSVTLTTVTQSGGGGTVGVERKVVSLSLIVPSLITLNSTGELLVPIVLKNDGDVALNKFSLGASSTEKTISLIFDKTNLDSINPGAEEKFLLRVKSDGSVNGRYSIDIEGIVQDPSLRKTVKLFVDITAAEGALKLQLDDQVAFTRDLFLQNPECLELEELIKRAEILGAEGKFEEATRLVKEANEACKDLLRKKPVGVKVAKEAFTWENWKRIALELAVLSMLISGLTYYLRRIRFKRVR